ncbi:hypothetical protein GCM10017044_07320 [Kordiimonas sediminis]|uniref:Uncharacterized protein n=1 Tax=Kordiimonas sediminis TaxID=1735581 RepID=A0A919E5Y0_9PROT|nr:hypothetical protein [Kordiimonas sediminis]GHF15669.1 hypothetical protein GCM10017044_07320 [Kordiimonas sediminis]
MPRTLAVTVLKEKEPYLSGSFDVTDEDYAVVANLLEEIALDRAGAEDLLIGYMHTQKVGQASEDIGKMAMVATVYMLKHGETDIVIEMPDGPPSGTFPQ